MSHRLIVLPDDGARPFLDAIEGAGHALDIRMFVFNDPGLLPAVAAARRRGVVVRVMLNRARRNGCDDNIGSRRLLADAGTDVRDSYPKFDLTHQKSMVVDGATGFIASLNWELGNEEPDGHARLGRRHRTSTRDARNDALLRGRLAALRFPAGTVVQPDLVPGQWTPANCQLHRHCPTFAVVQNEHYRNTVIIERLVRAAVRGVKVHILAKAPHTLKPDKLIERGGGLRILADVGVDVRVLHPLKLYGKMLLADGERRIDEPFARQFRRSPRIRHRDRESSHRRATEAMRTRRSARVAPARPSDSGLLHDLAKRAGHDPEKLAVERD